jgi:hypothetical protein
VTIPFSKVLAGMVPPVAVRLRRDFLAVLNLIRAHALLHQATRERDEKGRVVATVEGDYRVVRELAADLVAEGVDATVPQTMRETVEAVRKLVDDNGGAAVSLGTIAEELELDKSAASRRIRTAIAKGYVKNLEDRRGKPGRYVEGDPMPGDVVVLPMVEALLHRCRALQGGMQPPEPHSDAGSRGSVAPLQPSQGEGTPPPSDDGDDPPPSGNGGREEPGENYYRMVDERMEELAHSADEVLF